MTIQIDIADRLYDFSDEEKAAYAVEAFQAENGLDDAAVVAIWSDGQDPRRAGLEKRVFDAIDAGGTTKRARAHVPDGVYLYVETETAEY